MNKTIEITHDESFGEEIFELTYSAKEVIDEEPAIEIVMLKDDQGHDVTNDVLNPCLDNDLRQCCIRHAVEHEESVSYSKGWDDAILGVEHKSGKGKEYDRGYSESYTSLESLANQGGKL